VACSVFRTRRNGRCSSALTGDMVGACCDKLLLLLPSPADGRFATNS
jgi:hypothetical protein